MAEYFCGAALVGIALLLYAAGQPIYSAFVALMAVVTLGVVFINLWRA